MDQDLGGTGRQSKQGQSSTCLPEWRQKIFGMTKKIFGGMEMTWNLNWLPL